MAVKWRMELDITASQENAISIFSVILTRMVRLQLSTETVHGVSSGIKRFCRVNHQKM